jgi:predicted TIM-barrel fold metal-dependent hydrolase
MIHVPEREVDKILAQMLEFGILGGFAVGSPRIEGYSGDTYASMIYNKTDRLFPIAYYYYEPDQTLSDIRAILKNVRKLKYVGIKLHPRISKINVSDDTLPIIIREANEHDLSVMLCSYLYTNMPPFNTFDMLADMVYKLEGAKLMLMHSGAVRLLDAIELGRAYPNLLMDLSLTLCKYPESSLDMDISFAFKHFDRRTSIGSDYPDFSLKALRERFDFFAKEIPSEKAHNIAYKNILNFTGLKVHAT